jgi:hypothetical protein
MRAITGTARSAIADSHMGSKDVETLIDDFFDAVERELQERGIGTTVVRVEDRRLK